MAQHASISRRRFVQSTAAGSLALAGLGLGGSRAQGAKPNIVFIMADDLGYADVSCYGQRDYMTPNIDRLALEGMNFTQGYANSSVCSATRTALITGRYQYRLPVGLEEPINAATPKNIGLPPSHPTLPSLLKKAGYGTTLVGKWHLGFLPDFSPLKSGYDNFFGILGGAADYFNHGPDSGATARRPTSCTSRRCRSSGMDTSPTSRRSGGADRRDLRQVARAVHDEPAFHRAALAMEGPDDEEDSRRFAMSSTASRHAEEPTAPWSRASTSTSAACCRRSTLPGLPQYDRRVHQRQRGPGFSKT